MLLFDLDETLAHCVRQEKPGQKPDVRLDIKTASGKVLNAGFNVRPYTREMLEEVNKYYEVAVFTASEKWYANVICDYIDPHNKYFQHRLYRESCIKTTDNVYIKDLRVIKNVPMKDMILVDNAIYSFGLQLSNGIPIIPFKTDKTDEEFKHLLSFLLDCWQLEDLREPLKKSFHFEELFNEYKFENFIEYYDYEDCEIEDQEDLHHEEQLFRSKSPPSNFNQDSRIAKSVEDSLDCLQKCISKHSKVY